MKLRMDKTLRFWIDVAYDEIKLDHIDLTKQQLLAHILRQYGARSQPTDIYGGGVGALVKGALAYLERRNSMGRGQEATDG
jgi:hypothetical protein